MKKLLAMALALTSFTVMGCTQGSVQVNIESKEIVATTEAITEAKKLTEFIDNVINSNAYLTMVDGVDSYVTYLYNSHGEVFAQSSSNGYITVYRNDGKAVRYTDTVALGDDTDILSLVKSAIGLIDKGYAVMDKLTDSEEIEKIEDCDRTYITIKGWDNVKQLYMYKGEEFANSIVANMKESLKKDPNIKNVDTAINNFEIQFQIVTGKKGEFATDCKVKIGDNAYTSWYIDGYLKLYDWKLTNDWYSYDFNNPEKAEKMLTTLFSKLDKMMNKYADDNNIPKSTSENK